VKVVDLVADVAKLLESSLAPPRSFDKQRSVTLISLSGAPEAVFCFDWQYYIGVSLY
jgi:hypothetical protein